MNQLFSEVERIDRNRRLINKGINESCARSNSEVQELSNNITDLLNTIHQLNAKADAAIVASDKVRQDTEQLLSVKTKLDNIEQQIAISSDEIRKVVQHELYKH